MIGANPLLSALFHDEPTIEAFNMMGLDYNAVGNHEFDEGAAELMRMAEGGCHPVDGCLDGDVIADAQLYATAPAGFGDAVVAFMNPGGICTDLTYPSSPAGEGDGVVTYGEVFKVQPFGNSMVTMTLTGAQIDTALEQQFAGCGASTNRILQVSNGFTYEWSAIGAACSKVDPATIKLNGVVIDPMADYRVTVNSFLADGGDTFPIFTLGTNRLGGSVDTAAFEAYLAAFSPVAPGPQNRIVLVP
jgi:5'-nucleotidase